MSFRPPVLFPPSAEDIQLAQTGDKLARERVRRQISRVKKRQREIDAFDSAALAYAR